MNVRKLLYVADTNMCELLPRVVEKLISLKQRGLDEIVFYHTVSTEHRVPEFTDLSVKTKFIVANSISGENVLHVTKEEDPSLVVVHVDKSESKKYATLIKRLMMESSVPLLFMNGITEENLPRTSIFERIIFATDWSTPSVKAFEYILGLKELIEVLEIVHVIHEKLTVRSMRNMMHRIAETRKGCLDAGIDAESHIYAGQTAEEIIRASQDYRATLIVIGAKPPKSQWKELFRPHTTVEVTNVATVPILIIP